MKLDIDRVAFLVEAENDLYVGLRAFRVTVFRIAIRRV